MNIYIFKEASVSRVSLKKKLMSEGRSYGIWLESTLIEDNGVTKRGLKFEAKLVENRSAE